MILLISDFALSQDSAFATINNLTLSYHNSSHSPLWKKKIFFWMNSYQNFQVSNFAASNQVLFLSKVVWQGGDLAARGNLVNSIDLQRTKCQTWRQFILPGAQLCSLLRLWLDTINNIPALNLIQHGNWPIREAKIGHVTDLIG